MSWIRVFKRKDEAEKAKRLLEEGGFHPTITEDDTYGWPIKNKVPPRFVLSVPTDEYYKVAKYLSKKVEPH